MFMDFGKTGRQNTKNVLFSNLFSFPQYKFLSSTNKIIGSSRL